MDGFADGVVAAEGEGDVADTAADGDAGEGFADGAGGVEEGGGVDAVFVHAGGDGEDVGVEDDVGGINVEFVDEDVVGAGADVDAALGGVGLALFVEGHDDAGGAVAFDESGLVAEGFFAFFEADGVDDTFALDALKAGFEDVPFGGVDHDGYAGDIGFGHDEVEKAYHDGLGVDEAFVHVDVDNVGAAFDLLAGYLQGFVEVVFADEAGKFGGAGDVGAFADHDKVEGVIDAEGFEAAEAGVGVAGFGLAGGMGEDGVFHGADVCGGGAAAAAPDVGELVLGIVLVDGGHLFGGVVVSPEGVGEAGVGVDADVAGAEVGELLHVGAHVFGTEGAVNADGERLAVLDTVPEGGGRLAGECAAGFVGDGDGDEDGQTDVELVE